MLTYVKGDLLAQRKGILVHGCNGTKLPAGGIAGLIFKKWPGAEAAHHYLLTQLNIDSPTEALGLTSVFPVEEDNLEHPQLVIFNAITQSFPGSGSLSYSAIRDCCERLNEYASFYKYHCCKDIPIIMPKIGSGIAGGDWDIISQIIDETISSEHEVVIYAL